MRRILLTAAIAAALWPRPAAVLQAQERSALQSVWSTAFTAPDHPEWKIEDHLCVFLVCPPAVREYLRSLLANPANDARSLQELGQDTTQFAIRYIAGLMTDAARQRRARFDPAADPAIRCEPPSLITVVLVPLPMAIDVHTDDVVIHHDHWNTVRTISITDRIAPPSTAGPTRLGSSTARFQGSTLIVETSNLAGFTSQALTTTDGARIAERYAVSSSGARLDLELTIDDPGSFRTPLVITQSRVRTPDVTILDLPPCEAISGQP